jgi:hypothetical protein
MLATRRLLLLTTVAGLATTRAIAQIPGPAQAAAGGGTAARVVAPRDAYVYIGWPQDGQVINQARFKVWFGTRNFGVAPAGVATPNTGHHHLLIDTAMPPLDQPIPNDRNHLHFGLGQTETMLELPPGTHTLQLLMGDANHLPHDPPVVSRRITIQVRAPRGTIATQ